MKKNKEHSQNNSRTVCLLPCTMYGGVGQSPAARCANLVKNYEYILVMFDLCNC